jgi:pheromone shutdown protein TraB
LSGELDLRSEQVAGNFLLGVPFGFGLPFVVAGSTHRQMVVRGLGFAAGIELAQLLLGLLLYQAPYRVIDIDDVWLVFTGTLAGYGALLAAAHVYRRIGWGRGASVPVWNHLHGVLACVASGHATSTEPGAPPPRGAREPP